MVFGGRNSIHYTILGRSCNSNNNVGFMTEYDRPMNGAEISRELGISRQAVSYTLRRAMGKLYNHMLTDGTADTPFNAILALMGILGVNNSDINDIQQFLKMFDKKIIEEVTEEARKSFNIRE